MKSLNQLSPRWALVLLPAFALGALQGCSTPEKKPEVKNKIEFSTFSGLREYGVKDGFEVLTPAKLKSCMDMQSAFQLQNGALKDMQAAITLQKGQMDQANLEVNALKAKLDAMKTPDLAQRENYDRYNQTVIEYNQKVQTVREALVGYNKLLADYNRLSLSFNQGVEMFNTACALDKKLYLQDLQKVASK
ncbi:MAG: hypothetical protein JXR44_06110 [Thiotrichales bacterium]|nr:hypothetical protein [Thiotrichales bacterium]